MRATGSRRSTSCATASPQHRSTPKARRRKADLLGGMRIVIASLLALALLPASAQAQKPEDVTRVEAAISELGKLKRGSDAELAARRRAVTGALAACRSKGRGWTRIRAIRDRSQRDAYARGAK